ncbi:kinase-like domain-containing protein [Pseudoneurospora amorphoporcata]|uniref:cAMP-dependent protein kinase n=1 Tax=Pseudoneurospora amorphoporcata TaxID=241081 RepID=A0AAN6NYD8_9PEZI|nr:kinase-like domain-containing protein [Pseudoneurospora amorphoporcata]
MAATVASSHSFGGGLHPLQAKGLLAAAQQRQQQQQAQSQPQLHPCMLSQHNSYQNDQRRNDASQIRQNNNTGGGFEMATRKPQLSDFHRVRTLGTGTFARVVLVRPANGTDIDRQKVYALKILRKTEVIRLKQIDHVRHERQILKDVTGHPFITSLQASFADRDFLYLLLDYVPGGELFTYLRKYRRFDEEMARFYAAEIVLVLEYLHEKQGGIAYRDMKPENLLLDADGHIKLVDFGFAKRLGYKDDEHPVETYTLCGTPEYLAPEVIQNKGHTTAVDWWALGILIYEFLTGYPPFYHNNPLEIYRQIVEKPVLFPARPEISEEAKDIVRSFCTVDRSMRLGNMSGGAARVKAHPWFKGVDWEAVEQKRHKGPIIPYLSYPGDASCFDVYPEQDVNNEAYTEEMFEKYEKYFEDF